MGLELIPHLRARIVVSPERSDLVLSTHIPDVEFDILVCHGFDVESYGRDSSHALIEFELVEDG
jgi:hypothetical protein